MPSSSLVEVEVGVGVGVEVGVEVGGSELGLAKVRVEVEPIKLLFRSGGWEDELKNKTNLSLSLS